MWAKPATIMFCGLPVMVATLPMLLPVASAIRSGAASISRMRATSMSGAASDRQTTSLMKNAASTPEASTVIASSA